MEGERLMGKGKGGRREDGDDEAGRCKSWSRICRQEMLGLDRYMACLFFLRWAACLVYGWRWRRACIALFFLVFVSCRKRPL